MPTLRDYQRNFIGVIKSYIDRFPFNVGLYNQVIGEWNKTKKYLKHKRSFEISLSETETEEKPEPLHPKHALKKARKMNKKNKKQKQNLAEQKKAHRADDFDSYDGEFFEHQ